MKTRIIVIFGGVYSSLGKGITASSIARILKACNSSVACMKLEPYINVNPGMMSPFQHGEVYVTYDRGETDLDLGNYERFTNQKISYDALVTSGMIYDDIIKKERSGKFNGTTVQVVPHVTKAFKDRIYEYIKKNHNPDFLIIEVGGTVGDLESLAIIEALCELRLEIGLNNFLPILCAPIIHLSSTTSEFKTKPCQHAVRELSKFGIQPAMLVLRIESDLTKDLLSKMSLNCHIPTHHVFKSQTLSSTYLVPNNLFKQNIHKAIYAYFNIEKTFPKDLGQWEKFTKQIVEAKKDVTIAIVGKYMDLHDSYASVVEALKLAGWSVGHNITIKWISTDKISAKNIQTLLTGVHGILVPGGFGNRGTDEIMMAIRYARNFKVPYLGICYGMQLATIDFAREILKWDDANTTEIDPKTKHPVFDYIDGRMRLGEEICVIDDKNTLAYKVYRANKVPQRHRHRWEFNNKYLDIFKKHGYIISAHSNDKEKTAEMSELVGHPFFFGVQFHPEFSSVPGKNDGAFVAFINAAIKFNSKE